MTSTWGFIKLFPLFLYMSEKSHNEKEGILMTPFA